MDKSDILDKLAAMDTDDLDNLRNEKQVELTTLLKELHLAKDEEMEYKNNKRVSLLAEGNSFGKVENLLRADQTLYQLRRKTSALSALKSELNLEIEIIKNLYWRAIQ